MDYVTSQWVRWHPRGHLVLAGSEDSTVWMWNGDKGSYLNLFSGHGGSVTCGDFTPDGMELFFIWMLFHACYHAFHVYKLVWMYYAFFPTSCLIFCVFYLLLR